MTGEKWTIYWNEYASDTYLFGSQIQFHKKDDIEYINKYENYLKRKEKVNKKGKYEEEWNTTRIKSTNSNGLNNRKDGLPGYFMWDDYSTYYQSLKNKY